MKEFIKKHLAFIASLGICTLFMGAITVYATITTTGNFPTALNTFQDGDIINAGDWNNIETYIGIRTSSDRTTLSGKLNDLMSTTSMKQITTLANLVTVGTITSGTWNGSTIDVAHGGTGAVTLTGCLTGNGTGAITGTGSACGSGGSSSFSFPFTMSSIGGVTHAATSTTLNLTNGFLSTASSTISAPLRLSSLSQGILYTGSNGLVGALSTTTGSLYPSKTDIWIDVNRTDTYTADGSIFKPYTTITAANAAVTSAGYTSAAYHIAPGTYPEQSMTFPSIPLVIQGKGASLVLLSGANACAGTAIFPSDITYYDAVILGSTKMTSSSLTNPHSFINPFIAGSVTFSGLGTMVNAATVDQTTTLGCAANASSTLIADVGSIVGIIGASIQNIIVNRGTTNINDSLIVVATSTQYAVTSTTTGSVLHMGHVRIINSSTGGAINANNTATYLDPNALSGVAVLLGAGSTNGIDSGSSTTYLSNYNMSTVAGVKVYATGLDNRYPVNEGLEITGNSLLNVLGGLTGIGTSSPAWSLQVSSSTASTTFKPQFALSDFNAASGFKHWTFASEGGNFYVSTSSDIYATSTRPALTISGTGFGTTTVNGGFAITNGAATSTSNVGWNITSGCYAINGTCTSGGGAGSGTVTSVGLSLPSFFTITNSPVTSSGTLTGSIVQPNNTLVGIGSAGTTLVATGTPQLTVGNILATSTTANGTSTISNLGGVLNAVAFAGSDIGAKINTAYASAGIGSRIVLPTNGVYSFSTKIDFETANKPVLLDCQGAKLIWTGAATSTVFNNVLDNPYNQTNGMKNCWLAGSGGTSVGIQLGGNIGAPMTTIENNHITGFGKGIRQEANTYLYTLRNNVIENNTQAIYIDTANNSGENVLLDHNNISDCTTVTKCIYSEVNGLASMTLVGNSFDDTQVYFEDGNEQISFIGGHFENPNNAVIGQYTYIVTSPGDFTNVNIDGTAFYNGASTLANSPNQYILNGGNLTIHGITIQSFNGIVVPSFVVNYGGDGQDFQSFGYKDIGASIGVLATSSTNFNIDEDNGSKVAIGTSTAKWPLTLFNTTLPQLSFEGGDTDNVWAMRGIGNAFYIATASPTTFATTTTYAPFFISSTGTTTLKGLSISGAIATSTSNVGFNITSGCYAINGTCTSGGSGSGSVTSVGLSLPTAFTVTNSPVTTSGTLTATVNFARNSILTSDSAGTNFIATSSSPLYVDALVATSTSVVSTIGASTSPAVYVDPNYNQLTVGLGANTDRTIRFETNNPSTIIQDSSIFNRNAASGKGAYLVNQANSNYSSVQLLGTGAEYDFGMFGDTNFKLQDFTNSVVPFVVEQKAPNNSLYLRALSGVGVGTTSPVFGQLVVSSSTVPQLMLSNGTAALAQWTFRNAGGSLYLSTTTTQGLATSSISALEIAGGGFGTTTIRGLNISGFASSTSNVGFNITSGCYAINGTCVGNVTGGGTGTVTSVALTAPAEFSISGSPVTVSGTLALTENFPLNSILVSNTSGNGIIATTSQLTVGSIIATTTASSWFLGNNFGIGTTTFISTPGKLTIASTTTAQLSLEGGDTDNIWSLRSIGNNLYFATSSSLSQATTTGYSALTLLGLNGNIGIASSSPFAPFVMSTSHAKGGVGGLVFDFQDASTTLSSPLTYSYKTGVTDGALAFLGFNAYINAGGSAALIDTKKGGWEWKVDTRDGTTAPYLRFTSLSTAIVEVNALELQSSGHIITSGSAPSCDANCSFVTGNDNAFRVKLGTSKTTATITFAATWGTLAPICVANEGDAGVIATNASSTPTTVVVTTASAVTSKDVDVRCIGTQ